MFGTISVRGCVQRNLEALVLNNANLVFVFGQTICYLPQYSYEIPDTRRISDLESALILCQVTEYGNLYIDSEVTETVIINNAVSSAK